ncbi:MAG TPA: hypothetical protein PKO06_02290 [Candidatus Ozemobacteraceae bacterium]|nr:hypothetical protein [Candidatus Ozemobacteraceae bacterium]
MSSSPRPASGKTERIDDEVLKQIQIRNLSVQIPRPRDFLPDQTLVRLLRLPPGNIDVPGVDVTIEQHLPAVTGQHSEPTIDHTIRVVPRQASGTVRPLIFGLFSRARQNDDWNCAVEVLGQRLALGVQRQGEHSRRYTIVDERNRDRFYLRFSLNQDNTVSHSRMTGLNGSIDVPELRRVAEWLRLNLDVGGALRLTLKSEDTAELIDTQMHLEAQSLRLMLLPALSLENGIISCQLQKREGTVTNLDGTWFGRRVEQRGVFQLASHGGATASFSARVAEEPLRWTLQLEPQRDRARRIAIEVARSAGELRIAATQNASGSNARWRDGDLELRVRDGQRITDLIPSPLIPSRFAATWASMTTTVDLLGPLHVTGQILSDQQFDQARVELRLDGASMRDPRQNDSRLVLQGRILVASRSLELREVGLRLDRLSLIASGLVDLGLNGYVWQRGRVDVRGELTGTGDWDLDARLLQRLFALSSPPGFERLRVRGQRLLSLSVGPDVGVPTLTLLAEKALLTRGKAIWNCEPLNVRVFSPTPFRFEKPLPPLLQTELAGGIFGARCLASAAIDLDRREWLQIGMSADGPDLAAIQRTLADVPEVGSYLRKHQLTLGGSFQLRVSGKGPLAWPVMQGEWRFPALAIAVPGLQAQVPCQIAIETPAPGTYRGLVKTSNTKIERRGVPFVLDSLKATWQYERVPTPRHHLLTLALDGKLFDTELRGTIQYLPRLRRVQQARLQFEGRNLEKLSREVGRVGQFAFPFTMRGGIRGEWVASGTLPDLTSRATCTWNGIEVQVPIRQSDKPLVSLDVRDLSGTLDLVQNARDRFDVELSSGTARWLNAPLRLSGLGHLARQESGRWIPVTDRLELDLADLPIRDAVAFWKHTAGARDALPDVTDLSGTVSTRVRLSGLRNRYLGEGSLILKAAAFRLPGVALPLSELNGTIALGRRTASEAVSLSVDGLRGRFGRADVRIPRGRVIDPLGSCRIAFDGVVSNILPGDLLSLCGGWRLPALSFPREGSYAGTLNLSGTAASPKARVSVTGDEKTEILLRTPQREYRLPVGPCQISFAYEPTNGKMSVDPGQIGVLDGLIRIDAASAELRSGAARQFEVRGTFSDIDLGRFSRDGESLVRGTLVGTFRANQTPDRHRELLVHLGMEKLKILTLPVDQTLMERIGLDMLEEPEFATGTLNLYLSSEGADDERGRLRIADGLLAGPDLRLEISESAFEPHQLQIDGRLMFNPQPLRRTKVGKKLGKLTKLVQDKATGIPYIDLKVQGSWDKPNLIGKVIMDRLKKRGKRNFIRNIFGGHRPHKASVQELKDWFPGWEP